MITVLALLAAITEREYVHTKSDAAVGVAYTVLYSNGTPVTIESITLPTDNKKWFVTLVYDENRYTDQRQRKVAAIFASDATLQSLISQVKLTEIDSTSDQFGYYKSHLNGYFPQVWVWREDNKSAFSKSGAEIPLDPQELAVQIQDALKKMPPSVITLSAAKNDNVKSKPVIRSTIPDVPPILRNGLWTTPSFPAQTRDGITPFDMGAG